MNYEAPESIESAVALLVNSGNETKIFAGGTDLIVQMKEDRIEPTTLIDIKKIKQARDINITSDAISIGAAVTGAEIGECLDLQRLLPGVVEAVQYIGSDQVQGRATIGGNLCNASPAADSVPALIAARANIVIAGPDGMRSLAVEDFLLRPGKTVLSANEFVVSLEIPHPPQKYGEAYLRFTPRSEMDIAVVGVGVSVILAPDGTCVAARIAVGAVAPTARLVANASKILCGKALNVDVLDQVSAAVSAACEPINDKRGTVEFRTEVAGVMAARATKIAWQRAENSE